MTRHQRELSHADGNTNTALYLKSVLSASGFAKCSVFPNPEHCLRLNDIFSAKWDWLINWLHLSPYCNKLPNKKSMIRFVRFAPLHLKYADHQFPKIKLLQRFQNLSFHQLSYSSIDSYTIIKRTYYMHSRHLRNPNCPFADSLGSFIPQINPHLTFSKVRI
jgi:hypothetical protein